MGKWKKWGAKKRASERMKAIWARKKAGNGNMGELMCTLGGGETEKRFCEYCGAIKINRGV